LGGCCGGHKNTPSITYQFLVAELIKK